MNRATKSDSWAQNPDGTLGYTCSLFTGCLMGDAHPYCFAKGLANGRLKPLYLANTNFSPLPYGMSFKDDYCGDPFYPRFWEDRLEKLDEFLTKSKKPVGVFLNIMGEWAGDWIPRAWQDAQFEVINKHPGHRFYLLTHQPQNLIKFSPFPEHCYVGVTATDHNGFIKALRGLIYVQATVKFLSIEPFLKRIMLPEYSIMGNTIQWVIIGAQTNPYKPPKIEWVEEIVRAADRAGVKVFLKFNLEPLLKAETRGIQIGNHKEIVITELRQEMPK